VKIALLGGGVERTAIRAALEGSRELAGRALALHPLVPSVTVARHLFSRVRRAPADARGPVLASWSIPCQPRAVSS
jgi:alpha-galactosidase/6-phospho-beta-glucosidase family protein